MEVMVQNTKNTTSGNCAKDHNCAKDF